MKELMNTKNQKKETKIQSGFHKIEVMGKCVFWDASTHEASSTFQELVKQGSRDVKWWHVAENGSAKLHAEANKLRSFSNVKVV